MIRYMARKKGPAKAKAPAKAKTLFKVKQVKNPPSMSKQLLNLAGQSVPFVSAFLTQGKYTLPPVQFKF